VIDNLLATFREEYRRALTITICAAIIAAAALVAILFIGVAIFIWISENYGAVPACLAMAGFFVAVAGIAWVTLIVAQNAAHEREKRREAEKKKEKEEAQKNAPPAWLDPALIPTLLPIGIQAARIALRHRGLLLALVSSAAVGWAMLREKNDAPAAEDDVAAQPAE
jgi:H+/gluconate symporter-like permease